MSIVAAIPSFLVMVALGSIVDAIHTGSEAGVRIGSLTLALLALLGAILWLPRARTVSHAAINTEADIRTRLFERLLRAELSTVTSLQIGQIVARTTADLRLIRSFISGSTPVIARVIAGYIFLVIISGFTHPWLGLATVLPVLVIVPLAVLRVRRDTSAPGLSRELLGEATTALDESLRSIDVIRADNGRDSAYARVADLVGQSRKALTPVLVRNARFISIISVIPYLAFAAVITVGGILLKGDSDVSIGALVTVSLLMLQLAAPTISLASVISQGQEAGAAAQRIQAMLDWQDSGPDRREAGSQVLVRNLTAPHSAKPILRDLNLNLNAGELLGIQGDAGSGKTTLAQTLHGISPVAFGQVRTPTTALVTSEDMIFPGTIREAVTYGVPDATDEQIFAAAQQADLEEVVDSLPQGWETKLRGQGGTTLSGGEMQRLRLARALIKEADLLLIDSATVGLDAITLVRVNEGIAKQRDGKALITFGTHPSALGPTHDLATLESGRLLSKNDNGVALAASRDENPPEFRRATTATAIPKSWSMPTKPQKQTTASPVSRSDKSSNTKTSRYKRLSSHWESNRQRRALIWSLLQPDAAWLAVAVVGVAITALAALIPIYLSMEMLVEISEPSNSETLGHIAIALVGIALIGGGALFCAEFLIPWIGQRALSRLRLQAFRNLLDIHLAYFDRQNIGAIISKLTNNIQLLEEAVKGGGRVIVASVVTLIFAGALLAVIDIELAIVAYSVLPIIIVFALLMKRAQRWAMEQNVAGITSVTVAVREAVQGAATIRSFGTQNQHREKFAQYNEFERTALLRASYVFKSFAAATQFVVALDVAIIVGISGQDAVAGAVAVTTIVLFATYLQVGISPISTVATMQAVYGQTGVALDQLVSLTKLRPDAQLSNTRSLSSSKESGPALSFDHVWFAYSKAGWVLKDVSLNILRGEHVVIVGKTGGGKSSLAKLGLRFYAPTRGTVNVFGVDLGQADESWLRRQIAYVPQEPMVFSGTLRDNLAASRKDASDAQIDGVINVLVMRESVVDALGGLNAKIGGDQVSAGQRQLIAIARALISDRPILILDEATSHLDPATETLVISALRAGNPDRTIIAIAHHLDWASQGDQVIVVADQGIAEVGPAGTLLASDGEYSRLWSAHERESL